MAQSLHAPTESTPHPTNTPGPADRYALWFFAGTLVLSLLAMAWAMMGL